MTLPTATADSPATILIADDHPLFRDALSRVVSEAFPSHRVIEAESRAAAVAALDAHDPELVLLDLNMPGMNGFTGLIALREHAPATPIVIISADEDLAVIRQALTFGASGFIPKSVPREQLTAAIRLVLAGEVFVPAEFAGYRQKNDTGEAIPGYSALTQQQRKVLEALASGKPNKVIAHELDITEGTVKAHVSAILRKLGVTSRTQAVLNLSKRLGHHAP